MTKRIIALVMLIALCASLVGCGTKGAPDVKKPKEQIVNIEDYINNGTAYFMPDMSYAMQAIMEKELSRDEAFNEFVGTWGENVALPDELVKSYADKLIANNEGMSEDEAKKLAVSLIKEELVVAMAFKTLCGDEAITDDVRANAAADFGLAAEESEDASVVSESYALDAFIKQQTIAAYLNGEEGCYGISFAEESTDESSEESSEAISEESTDESSEASSEASSEESTDESSEAGSEESTDESSN